MRLLYTFFFFLICSVSLYSQNNGKNDMTYYFSKEYEDINRLYHENKLDSAIIKLKELESFIISSKNHFFVEGYIITIYSLSNIYAKQGNIKKSERKLNEADQILSKNGELTSPYYRLLLLQRGELLLLIDNYESARKMLLKSKQIFEMAKDVNSVEYALCLSDLSLTFQKTGDYWFSNILLKKAVSVFKLFASEKGFNAVQDPRYLTIWNNLSLNYQLMGDKEMAEKIRNEILSITNGDNEEAVFFVLLNKAYQEIQNGNLDLAIEMINNAYGNEHGVMYNDYIYQNLIISLYLSNDERVVDVLNHYCDYSKRNILLVTSTYSEAEREEYWSQKSLLLEMITNAVCWKYQSPEMCKLAYNNTLFVKSILAGFPRWFVLYAQNNPSDIVNTQLEKIKCLKKNITNKNIQKDSVIILKDSISSLEKALLSSIDDVSKLTEDSFHSCEDIEKNLSLNEVAIEFILIPEFKLGNKLDIYYGALIERNDFESPVVVKLCNKRLFDQNIERQELPESEMVKKIYDLSNDYFYKHIFQPIEKYIKVGDTIYFSPVSGIYNINLPILSNGEQRLMDKYTFYEVSSSSKLIERKEDGMMRKPIKSALLFGGIDYNVDKEEVDNQYVSDIENLSLTDNRGSWDIIPETLEETRMIDSLLTRSHVNTTFLSGGKAEESSFKLFDGNSPEVIHIATHGFFFKGKEDISTTFFDDINVYTRKRRALLYGGLLFAGANRAWTRKTIPSNSDEGILTAEEISQLDLSGTNMVILSACDTGLGKIDDIDGVYGLQRGFKMAGVETIIMSLWKVSDKATRLLMVEFYKNLMAGKSKHQSLKDAQQYLRSVENGKYDKPEYWASFIMLDGLD